METGWKFYRITATIDTKVLTATKAALTVGGSVSPPQVTDVATQVQNNTTSNTAAVVADGGLENDKAKQPILFGVALLVQIYLFCKYTLKPFKKKPNKTTLSSELAMTLFDHEVLPSVKPAAEAMLMKWWKAKFTTEVLSLVHVFPQKLKTIKVWKAPIAYKPHRKKAKKRGGKRRPYKSSSNCWASSCRACRQWELSRP